MRLWPMILFFGLAQGAAGVERSTAITRPEAAPTERLSAVAYFALGGVGYAGTTSPGELALQQILREPDATVHLQAVFAHGTPAAKCYALVGLRETASPLYAGCAAEFRRAGPDRVNTMRGCMETAEPVRPLLDAIERGDIRAFMNGLLGPGGAAKAGGPAPRR